LIVREGGREGGETSHRIALDRRDPIGNVCVCVYIYIYICMVRYRRDPSVVCQQHTLLQVPLPWLCIAFQSHAVASVVRRTRDLHL
jgi:hypothetical protein